MLSSGKFLHTLEMLMEASQLKISKEKPPTDSRFPFEALSFSG